MAYLKAASQKMTEAQKASKVNVIINPFSSNIKIQILLTDLRTFSIVLVGRIFYTGFQLTLATTVWKSLGNLGLALQNSHLRYQIWQPSFELANELRKFSANFPTLVCNFEAAMGQIMCSLDCLYLKISMISQVKGFFNQNILQMRPRANI